MTGTLRRVLVNQPDARAVATWRAYGWRAAADPAGLAPEHDAFRGLLADAGVDVVVGGTPVPGDPDAIYSYDPAASSRIGISPVAPDLAVGYPPLVPVRLVELLNELGSR